MIGKASCAAGILAALVCSRAWADDPATLILPTPLVVQIVQYLNTQPRGAVNKLATDIEGCVRVQVPNPQGAILSHGECREVTAAVQEQAALHDKAAQSDNATKDKPPEPPEAPPK